MLFQKLSMTLNSQAPDYSQYTGCSRKIAQNLKQHNFGTTKSCGYNQKFKN